MSDFALKNLPKYECLLKAAARYPDLDPSACQAFLHVVRAGSDAFQLSAPHFAKLGISGGGFMVLMLLHNACGTQDGHRSAPAELADLAGVARATMTGLIDTLEREGFVERQADPEDRRKAVVSLTPAGRALLEAILPGHFQRMAEFMRPLSEAERGTLVRLLQKVLASSRPTSRKGASSAPKRAA